MTSITQGGSTVKSFSYDTAGRTTGVTVSGNTTTLAYDFEGRVTTITYPNSSANTFAYNGLDTRVSKVDSGGTKTFLRDGAGVTAPVLADAAAVFTPSISERRSSTTTYYHNGFKNAESQTIANETVSATQTFDAFGLPDTSSGTWKGPFAYGGPYGYQSDADSGLMLLGHRYYDASTGRFLSRDPAKDGRNWYTYCYSKPTILADPSGLFILTIGGGGQLAGGGSLSGSMGLYYETDTGAWGPSATTGGGGQAGWETALTVSFSVDYASQSSPISNSGGWAVGYDTPWPISIEINLDDNLSVIGWGGSIGYSPGNGPYAERRQTASMEIVNPSTGNNIVDFLERLKRAMIRCIYLTSD